MNSIGGQEVIKFYRADRPYGFLSNLFKKPIIFEEREFPASEYAFLFGIFNNEEVREWAMKSPKPHLLSILAHGLFVWDMVKNWNKIRVDRMYKVLKVKFTDKELREKLLETGNSILIEDSKTDPFWGIGKKGNGKNMLGKLLMKVREEIRKCDEECREIGFCPYTDLYREGEPCEPSKRKRIMKELKLEGDIL